MKNSRSSKSKGFDFRKAVSSFSDSPALITENQVIDYADYFRQTSLTTQNLIKSGFKTGDRIAILSQNSIEYIILIMAIIKIKAVAVPLNTRFPMNQIMNLLSGINCKTVVHSEEIHPKPKSNEIVFFEIDKLIHNEKSGNEIDTHGKISLDQDMSIIFTSGSTSQPKAVLHTFRNHYYSALGSNQNISFQKGDSWLFSLPMYHVGGIAILFRALIGGGAVIAPENTSPLSDSILKFKPTHISLVPTQLYRLLNNQNAITHLKKIKAILLGGSSIPTNLIQKAVENDLPIFTSYGLTEMASQVTTTLPGEKFEKLKTSGKSLNHRQLRIAEDGEILVQGETLFKGYVHGSRHKPNVDPKGWFATGDLGFLDSKGYLTVTGRKDNMFISGGENIQPEEIEKELLKIDGVREALVVPVKNDEFGYRPVAFIEKVDNLPESEFFNRFLQENIPRFKIPDYFFPFPDEDQFSGIKPNRLTLSKIAEKFLHIED